MTVDAIIDGIIKAEGTAFTNDPADPGGPTKYGITQKTLGQYLGRKASVDEVRNLTEAQARTIYLLLYVKAPGFDGLPDPLRVLVIDAGVNHGQKTAAKILQTAVNGAAPHIGHPLVVDGAWGPKSRERFGVLAKGQRQKVYAIFLQERLKNYAKQVKASVIRHDRVQRQKLQSGEMTPDEMTPVNQSTKLRFLVGWINRAAEFIGEET